MALRSVSVLQLYKASATLVLREAALRVPSNKSTTAPSLPMKMAGVVLLTRRRGCVLREGDLQKTPLEEGKLTKTDWSGPPIRIHTLVATLLQVRQVVR